MGGQACVFYGAAEFSRDCDIAILCEPENLSHLKAALDELEARTIAVPPFEEKYLLRGHAVHFRCQAPGVEKIRVDVMARMRGVADFDELWSRRTTFEVDSGNPIELMSLADLVTAKKTQREKDWPMIRRLIESNYAVHGNNPSEEQVRFWLAESRTPQMLIELAARYADAAISLANQRPLLSEAIAANHAAIRLSLAREQETEREADRNYWKPLKEQLEALRHGRP